MPVPAPLIDVVDEAIGRRHRPEPITKTTGGPAGNARITAWTGLLFLLLVLAQLVTVLDVSGLISWHIVLGTLLVPVALLKTASTSWRVGRYYTGHRAYRTAGPPPTLLRLLGPLVVATTLGLLGSGLALIALGRRGSRQTLFTVVGQRIDPLTLHQVMFFAFAGVVGLHLVTRLVPALTLVAARAHRAVVPGGSRRAGLLVLALLVAGVTATLVLGAAGSWR